MPNQLHQLETGLLLSGGIDSAVLLDQLLVDGWQVVPFYVRTGCVWQLCELKSVRQFLARLERPGLREPVVLNMPLDDLYRDHWSMSGVEVPDETSADAAVFLPGRNPLMLLKPAIWCAMNGIKHLALATLANNPFPDAMPEFFARFEAMLHTAMHVQVQISRPFEHFKKKRVLEMGHGLPLELTFSCLNPVEGLHCGRCNKCAERHRAFREIGIDDPTEYAEAGAASR